MFHPIVSVRFNKINGTTAITLEYIEIKKKGFNRLDGTRGKLAICPLRKIGKPASLASAVNGNPEAGKTITGMNLKLLQDVVSRQQTNGNQLDVDIRAVEKRTLQPHPQ